MFTKTIEEVTETLIDYRGKTPPKTNCGVKLITAKIIKDGFVLSSNLEYISEEIYESWMRRGIPKQWDILITTEAPLGEVAQLRTNEKIALAQRVILLRGNPQVIHQQFYFQALKSPFVQAALQMRATGTTVAGIKQSELRQVEIPLPSLSTQRKIADILSTYDDLIEINQERITLLERAGREIYREWFVRLRFPGYERTKIVDGVPADWERVHLSRLVSTQYGYTASANERPVGPKFLRGTDINKRSYIDWEAVPYCPEDNLNFEKYALRQGDLLVIRMADPGKVAIVEKEIRAIFASYLVRLSIRKDAMIDPLYLFNVLAGAEYQGFMQAASAGSTRKSASAKLLTNFNVLRPPKSIQDSFVEQIRPMREMIDMLLDQNSKAETARDLMLPRLMSGQLIVC